MSCFLASLSGGNEVDSEEEGVRRELGFVQEVRSRSDGVQRPPQVPTPQHHQGDLHPTLPRFRFVCHFSIFLYLTGA